MRIVLLCWASSWEDCLFDVFKWNQAMSKLCMFCIKLLSFPRAKFVFASSDKDFIRNDKDKARANVEMASELVPSAGKPACFSSTAEAPSQALGMTKPRGASCSARNRSWASDCRIACSPGVGAVTADALWHERRARARPGPTPRPPGPRNIGPTTPGEQRPAARPYALPLRALAPTGVLPDGRPPLPSPPERTE